MRTRFLEADHAAKVASCCLLLLQLRLLSTATTHLLGREALTMEVGRLQNAPPLLLSRELRALRLLHLWRITWVWLSNCHNQGLSSKSMPGSGQQEPEPCTVFRQTPPKFRRVCVPAGSACSASGHPKRSGSTACCNQQAASQVCSSTHDQNLPQQRGKAALPPTTTPGSTYPDRVWKADTAVMPRKKPTVRRAAGAMLNRSCQGQQQKSTRLSQRTMRSTLPQALRP